MSTTNIRETRGLEIAQAKESQITRIDALTYKVLSQSGMANMLSIFLKMSGDVSVQIIVFVV
jgi:hypothetical protein